MLSRSSNIDAAISTGSIFGIYDPNDSCTLEDMDDPEKMVENCVLNVCQPGACAPRTTSALCILALWPECYDGRSVRFRAPKISSGGLT